MDGLNPQQKKAVEAQAGPLLIMAGAGSGKTRTLTTRIAHLIDRGVGAWRILAITFTNKAAREMAERLEELVGDEAGSLWVGTFHGIALRIIRAYPEKLGYDRDFVIYDSSDQRTLLNRCLKELDMDPKRYPVKMVRSLIGQAKSRMLRLSEYKDHLDEDLWDLFLLYERRLKEYGALDFDNILFKLVELFEENEDIRQKYENRFHEVLVDEYQDTNRIQYHIVHLLTKAKKNLVVVGDIDQSIYGWRGADIRNIVDFKMDFPGAEIITLEQNYRSTKRILEAANALIDYNKDRPNKNLWTDLEVGDKIKIYNARNEHDEADYVVRSIEEDLRRGISPEEIAVLYRTHSLSSAFENALVTAGIHYQVYGGQQFYERREIKDVLSYLRVLVNPRDEISFLRAMGIPKRGLGEASIEKLTSYSRQYGLSLYEGAIKGLEEEVFSARIANPLKEFMKLLEEARVNIEDSDPYLLGMDLLEASGYIGMLKESKLVEDQARLENIQELFNDIASFYARGEGGLEDYLLNVALMTDMDQEDKGQPVMLMTLHSAKGLEFTSVYLVGMDEDIFPSYLSLESDDLEEERRLCYVAITRAMKKLVLTRSDTRFRFGQPKWMEASRFIDEIPQDLLYFEGKKKGSAFQRTIPFGSEKKSAGSFSPGERVYHKVFGSGVVVGLEKDSKKIKVAFEKAGIKELHLDYAPLRKE